MATRKAPLNMPTQKSVGHNSHASSINDFNLQMRNQPWYQDWFHRQGLDPNQVHLSGGQRKDLQNTILQNGGVPADAFNDMKIDPAGNLNTEHGFASQPTWLKAIEIGAPIAATAGFGAAGMGPLGGVMGGSSGAAGGAGATAGATGAGAAGTAGAGAAGSTVAGGAGTVGTMGKLGKFFGGDLGKLGITGGLGLLEGMMTPKPQVRKGFTGNVDPSKLLGESNERLKNMFGGLLKDAQAPMDFSHVRAQTPAGLTGTDPGVGMRPGMGGDMNEMMQHLASLGVKL